MKLLPWNSEKRVSMKAIIIGVIYAVITMTCVITTMECDKPRDIPIEVLK